MDREAKADSWNTAQRKERRSEGFGYTGGMRWTVVAAIAFGGAACRAEPHATPAASQSSASVPPIASTQGSTVAVAQVDLQAARIVDVLPMLEALSDEPVIVDPDAEPIVRCGVINVRSEAELPSRAMILAIAAELRASGLKVIDTKKGIVLQRLAGAPLPACP